MWPVHDPRIGLDITHLRNRIPLQLLLSPQSYLSPHFDLFHHTPNLNSVILKND